MFLQNLLFSANLILPIFLVIGAGCAIRQKGLFTDDYVKRSIKLIYYIFLPAKLFLDISGTDIKAAFSLPFLCVIGIGSVVQFLLAWLGGNLLCKDKRKQSAFSHACFRGNFVYMGVALLQDIYGGVVPETAMILALLMPLYNIQGAILMSVKEGRGSVHISKILLDILKNPMILALLAGMPFALLEIPLPHIVTKTLDYFRSGTSIMALLVVGASLRMDTVRRDFRLLLKISSIKLLLMPAIWVVMAMMAGLTTVQTVVLAMVGGMPSAINVFVITDQMGGDGELACGAVVMTHLVSLFTVTGMALLMRSIGWI